MNSSFEDVKCACFGDKSVATITYGEVPTGDRLIQILAVLRGISVCGPKSDAHIHALRATGKRPLVLVVYRFRFPRDIPAMFLLQQVRESVEIPKAKVDSYCWLLEPLEYRLALGEFRQGLPANPVSQRSENGVDYAFTVKPGQRLATLITAHEPLPNVMVA